MENIHKNSKKVFTFYGKQVILILRVKERQQTTLSNTLNIKQLDEIGNKW